MLSTPLTRIAKCAAIVAVLCTVLFPPQWLVCRGCLAHGLASFASDVGHAAHDNLHAVDEVEHCHSCGESAHCGSEGNFHENCPCELMRVDVALVFSPNVAQKISVEFVAYSFSVDLRTATSVRGSLGVDPCSTSRRPSLPLVLRI